MTQRSAGRVVIIGGGPTGLGAAHRLEECGHGDWLLLEAENKAGGLSRSFTDDQGFTWDIGGHVQHSHYGYFDRLMAELLPDAWLEHERESWVWIMGRFVPYPFQYNIRHLPSEVVEECVAGLRAVRNDDATKPANFEEWIRQGFGAGISRIFMLPYNYKVWAHPPGMMAYHWIGDRVATIDLERLEKNIAEALDDVSWGPNNTFFFPARGGTGEIWRRLAAKLPGEKIKLGARVVAVDADAKRIRIDDGADIAYDTLISTMPVDRLVAIANRPNLRDAASRLCYSTVHIFGLGMAGKPSDALRTKCWMYFPEDDSPFFRATVFSNYSPNNVPDIDRNWSLMLEVSESPYKAVDREHLLEEVIQGCLNTKLIGSREEIVDTWRFEAGHGYPTPALGRNEALEELLPALARDGIYSRGRFGAWKYEVSNQDHALMQGVEVVDFLLKGEPEVTVHDPGAVNKPGGAPDRR